MSKERYMQVNRARVAEELGVDGDELSFDKVEAYIKDPNSFAKRIEAGEHEVAPGVRVKQHTVELGDGHYTNVYELTFASHDHRYRAETATRQTPLYQSRLLQNDRDIIACMNGAFFFLADGVPTTKPEEVIYHLHMRDGKLVGMPSADRPALITTLDGVMSARELSARGVCMIGTATCSWVGGERHAHTRTRFDEPSALLNMHDAVLYNSACCSIEYEDPNDKTTLRLLNDTKNKTPKSDHVKDIVVVRAKDGSFSVGAINEGGGTDFFAGAFVLQCKHDAFPELGVGDRVDPQTIDGLDIAILQSALTTGPSTDHFLAHDDHPINHDTSLGTFPPFDPGARYARSLAYEDAEGYIHFVVCDAVPRSTHMKGVTPKEAAQLVPPDAKWSVFLDGGQSSRISVSTDDGIEAYGNKQYVRLHVLDKKAQGITTDARYLWTGKGRGICSMLELRSLQGQQH